MRLTDLGQHGVEVETRYYRPGIQTGMLCFADDSNKPQSPPGQQQQQQPAPPPPAEQQVSGQILSDARSLA